MNNEIDGSVIPAPLAAEPVVAAEPVKTEATKVENMKITIEPKKSCKRCHGIGRIGYVEGDHNNPMICDCVMKVYKKLQANNKLSKFTKQEVVEAPAGALDEIAKVADAVEQKHQEQIEQDRVPSEIITEPNNG